MHDTNLPESSSGTRLNYIPPRNLSSSDDEVLVYNCIILHMMCAVHMHEVLIEQFYNGDHNLSVIKVAHLPSKIVGTVKMTVKL